jgi:hypothetical protein
MTWLQACRIAPRIELDDRDLRMWVLVVDGDTFVAYRITPDVERQAPLVPPLPPPGCARQPIAKVEAFVREELWLPATVEIVPVSESEPYVAAVARMVRQGNLLILQLSPALESFSDVPQAQVLKARVSELERKTPPACFGND